MFLRGRLKFGNAATSAPFPSAIVIFWGGRLGDATRSERHDRPKHEADSDPHRVKRERGATNREANATNRREST